MSSNKFKYKRNMADVVERHGKLWTKNFTNKILVKIDIDGLDTIDFHTNFMKYAPDYRKMFSCYKEFYRKRKDLLDDSVPVARASIGSAALSHYFGGEVQFTPGGAFSRPIINDLKNFDFSILDYNPNNKWIKYQMEMIKYFNKEADGLFPVCITEVLMGLLWTEYLLGEKTYTNIYDNPELIMKLLEKSVEFNIRYVDEQRRFIDKYDDGVFEMFEVWLQGNQIWNCMDTYGNCSPDVYLKFGKPFFEEIGRYFGGQWMHMHSNALYLVKEVAKTKFISGISIIDDFNAPRGFEKLDEIYEDANGIPLHIFCTKEELISGMKDKTLKRNIYYWCNSGVKTIKEANEIMQRVYEY
jgi:hypothetical protein